MTDEETQSSLNRVRKTYKIGPNATVLNTVDIWTTEASSVTNDQDKIWAIYIHGGAWRDPEVDSMSFEGAVQNLWGSSARDRIAGFASINYRLSPYPSHPKFPSSPDDSARNSRHPDHLDDVAAALVYLDQNYSIANRYLLAGHSAGGTIAFQLSSDAPQPLVVLGISGIYDLGGIVEHHKDIPVYSQLMLNAFSNRDAWDRCSPASSHFSTEVVWKSAKAIIISHSAEDELVEEAQATEMLERARGLLPEKDNVHFVAASGRHDEIWGEGKILGGIISQSLEILDSMK